MFSLVSDISSRRAFAIRSKIYGSNDATAQSAFSFFWYAAHYHFRRPARKISPAELAWKPKGNQQHLIVE